MAAPSKLMRRSCFIFALMIGTVVAACDDAGSLTAPEFFERAQGYRADGDLRASVIELKNALQRDPDHGLSRLLLGQIYVEFGQGADAEKELTRAGDLGTADLERTIALGQAWLLQRKYQVVLDKMVAAEAMTNRTSGRFQVLRGNAHFGLRNTKAAERSFRVALAHDPKQVGAMIGLSRVALSKGDLARAESTVERAEQLAPLDAGVLRVKGDLRFFSKRFDESEAAYKALIKVRPFDRSLLLLLARTQVVSGKTQDAIDNLEMVLKIAPRHPGANHLRALAAYGARDYETAKERSLLVLEAAPNFLPSQLIAGTASYALGRFEQANSYLTGFLAEVPAHELARRLRGATLIKLGRSEEALETLKSLEEENPDDAQLLVMIGTAAINSGDLATGRDYFQKFTQVVPDSAEGRARLGAIELGLGNSAEGIRDLEAAAELDPKLDKVLIALFAAHFNARQYDDALDVAKRILIKYPKNPAGHTLTGIAEASRGNEEAARAAFIRALELQPGAPDASSNLAQLDLRNGDVDKARERLLTALKHFPTHVGTMVRLARLEAGEVNYDATLSWLEKAVEADSTAAVPRLLLARFHLLQGEPRKALTVASPFLREHTDAVRLRLVVGRAQLALGLTAEAVSSFRDVVEARPQSAQAHYLLATAYRRRGDRQRYGEELERTLTLQPKHLRAKIGVAQLAAVEGDKAKLGKLIGPLLADAPENPAVAELAGALSLARREFDDAVTYFGKASAARPSSQLTINLARAQWAARDRPASVATLESWLGKFPNDTNVRTILGDQYLALSRLADATDAFQAVVKARADDWKALNNLAYALWRRGEVLTARRHAERARELAPEEPMVMDTLGVVLLDSGDHDAALALLRRASERLPKNNEIKVHLAQALAKLGEAEQALGILRKALSGDEAFTGRQEAETLLKELGG